MISARPNRKKLGIVCGLLIFALGLVFLAGQNPQSISIIYMGMRDTPWPDGPRPLFVLTNPLPYRITWTMLAPEFELPSGWTATALRKVRFGGETLEPGARFETYGISATNAAYRYPVLWGLHPADALERPRWKKVADDWCERVGIRPLFLPHGVRCSRVVPPKSPSVWTHDREGKRRVLCAYPVARTIIERHIQVRGEATPYEPEYVEYFEKRRCFAWRAYPVGKLRAFGAG